MKVLRAGPLSCRMAPDAGALDRRWYIGLHLAIAAFGLTGCASPSRYSDVSAGGYEPAVLSGQPAPGLGTQTRAGEARRGRTDMQQARRVAFTTDVSAYPPIPVTGGEYEPAVLSSQPAPGLGTQGQGRPVEAEQMCSNRDVMRSQLMF